MISPRLKRRDHLIILEGGTPWGRGRSRASSIINESLRQLLFEQTSRLGHRFAELGGILAAGLGHIGASAAAAAHDRRDLLDEIAGLDAALYDVVRHRR